MVGQCKKHAATSAAQQSEVQDTPCYRPTHDIPNLRGFYAANPVLGKLVCSCNNVGSQNITDKISAGCDNLKDLCTATAAGLGCGSCRPEVKRLLDEELKKLAV